MIGIHPEIRYSVLIGLLFAHFSFDAPSAKAIEQSPTASVLDFGAKCDGTTDDTRAIQAAIKYRQTGQSANRRPYRLDAPHLLIGHAHLSVRLPLPTRSRAFPTGPRAHVVTSEDQLSQDTINLIY